MITELGNIPEHTSHTKPLARVEMAGLAHVVTYDKGGLNED